jgi:prevent-host-death family protein
VRELHDQLSRYVRHAAAGGEVVVTMRGRRVARLTAVAVADPLADLRERGLVVATWDRDLAAAATRAGRAVVGDSAH